MDEIQKELTKARQLASRAERELERALFQNASQQEKLIALNRRDEAIMEVVKL